MNTDHYQQSAAYLDAVLMTLEGDKVVIISYGTQQDRFYISACGTVSRCDAEGPTPASESDFELYRMTFLEALLDGGSLIIRQIGAGLLQLPETLGGGTLPVDYLSAARVGPKGIRALRGSELQAIYQQGADGAVEYHDFLSKEQVKLAVMRMIESEQS